MTYTEAIELLIRLGFEEFDLDKDGHFEPSIELGEGDRMFTDKGGRNAIYVVVSEYEYGFMCGYYFTVYVLENVGCGAVELPFLWADLDEVWIRHLQHAFGNLGFNN